MRNGSDFPSGGAVHTTLLRASRICASSLSVSVAVWSDSDEAARRDELERLPLPWEANWTQAEITLAAAQFLRSIMVYAHLNSTTAARRALQSILTSRFEPLRALPVEHQEGLLDRAGVKDEHVEDLHGACRRDEAAGAKIGPTTRAFERVMSVSQLQSHVDAGARRVADAARAIAPRLLVSALVLQLRRSRC